MNDLNLYRTESLKENEQFVSDFKAIAQKNGFVIHNSEKMNMHHSFAQHGIYMDESFDLHMIQVCKPEKAAKSLSANPERAILMPKFLMTFTNNGKTQIRFLRFSEDGIKNIVRDDAFPGSLAGTYDKIIAMIEDAK